jgi:parallel beta-helix repeat protein
MDKWLLACFLSLLALCATRPAAAAECTEIIGPDTIMASGARYCLGQSIVVNKTGGYVVQAAADGAELDCRGYSMINTNTNPNGNANAIEVLGHRNIRIRNCNITGGFAAGIYVYQDNGLENQNRNIDIEGNTIAGTYWYGIHAYGTGISIRNNRVRDIGGRGSFAMGIRIGGSLVAGESRHFVVEGNHVVDVESPGNNSYGIYGNNADASTIAGNIIHGVRTTAPAYYAYAISANGAGTNKITGNTATGSSEGVDYGIYATNAANECYQNHVRFMNVAISNCDVSDGNY